MKERLSSLGIRCELIDSSGPPRGWRAADGDLLLVLDPEGFSSSVPVLLSRRAGTRLEDLPVVVISAVSTVSPVDASQVDEILDPALPDSVLLARLRVWARWGGRARKIGELEARLRDAQEIDPVTGLPGHRSFQDRLDIEVRRSERYGSPLGLILADLDGTRFINDRYGHKTGDRVLREIGETLRHAVRDVDMVARYEGDQFGILLPEAAADTAAKVVSRLRHLVSSLIFRGESAAAGPSPLLKIHVHFGLAGLPDERLKGKSALLEAATADLERERATRTPPAILA